MKITVGTRGSQLALVQTNWVIEALKRYAPDLEVGKCVNLKIN